MGGRIVAGILVTVAILSSTAAIQKWMIDPHIDTGLNEELLYFPNEKLINHFTGGLSPVIADIMWIRTISYAAAEFKSKDKKFAWLEHMCRTIVSLDPYYEDVYTNGGIILAALGRDEQALNLLRDGMLLCPHSYDISFELAKVYILNRQDEPSAAAMAIHHLGLVAECSDTPEFYLKWMDRIRTQGSLEGEAERAWRNMLENSEDDFIRQIVRAQLAVLEAERIRDELRAAAESFRLRTGRAVSSMDELYRSGLAPRPVEDDAHGRYYLAQDGKIRNTVLDARVIDRVLNHLRTLVGNFNRGRERYPASLDELAELRGETAIAHPVPGHVWLYDPATGEVHDGLAEDSRL